MRPADIAAARDELSRRRQEIDIAIGAALQALDKLERDMTERARDERLSGAELASFGHDLDHPLDTSTCERCDQPWPQCTCGSPA